MRTHRVVAKSSSAETERNGSPRTYAQGMSCLASRSENHRAPDVPSHPASSQPPTTIVSPSAFASARNLSPMWWCGRPKWNRILRSKPSASHVRIHIIICGISEEHPGGIAATQEYNEPRKGLVCVRSVAAKPRRPNPSRNSPEGTDRCWAKRLHHSEAYRVRPSVAETRLAPFLVEVIPDPLGPAPSAELGPLERDRGGGPAKERTSSSLQLSPSRSRRSPPKPTGTESAERRPDR